MSLSQEPSSTSIASKLKLGSCITGKNFAVFATYSNGKIYPYCLLREGSNGEIFLARRGRAGLKCFLGYRDKDWLLQKYPNLNRGEFVTLKEATIRVIGHAQSGKSLTGEFTWESRGLLRDLCRFSKVQTQDYNSEAS